MLDLDEQNEFLIESYNAMQRAVGVFALAVHGAMDQQVAKRHGEHSLSTHIAAGVHGSSKRIGAELAVARWLARFSELRTALADGTITVAHVNELRTLERKHPKASASMERAQGFFIDAAQTLQFPQWVDSVGYWFNALDPDGVLHDPTDPKYGATVTRLPSGDVIVEMRLDPVTGEAWLVATEREEQKIFEAEADLDDADKLSPRQRTMTAIMRLVARGFQQKDGTFPEPMVQLVMSEKVAEDLLARAMGCIDPDTDGPMDFDPFSIPIDYDDLDRRCETLRGTAVHVSNFVRTSLLAPGGQNAPSGTPTRVCIRTEWAPWARGERSSRSDQDDFRECRPEVSTRSGYRWTTSNPTTTTAKPSCTTANRSVNHTTKPKVTEVCSSRLVSRSLLGVHAGLAGLRGPSGGRRLPSSE